MDALKAPDGKTRVLINALHSKSGGGVTYLRNLLPGLAEDPTLELHVLLHRNQLELFENLGELARFHLVDFRDTMVVTQLWEQLVLPFVARTMRADVVYSPANYGPLLVGNAVVLAANSLAVASKDVRLSKRAYWAAVATMTMASLLCARRALAVSHYAMESLLRWPFGFLRRKFTVIHLGVAPLFSPSAEPRQGNLLAVGDVYIQKNYHTLLHAMARLRHHHPHLLLKIAGRPLDRAYLDSLHALIKSLNLENNVHFLGSLTAEQLREQYRQCRLFVFASTVETFGIPLIEAMACGCAIAGSNRAAMPEVAGECMDYFDPDDAEQMSEVINRLLNDDQRRQDLAQRALRRAQDFSWRHTAQQTALVLKQAARKR